MSAPTPPNQPPAGGGQQPPPSQPPAGGPPPPSGPPTPPSGRPTPPPRNPAEDDAAISNRKQLTGFKIATVVLAVLSLILAIFAFTLNKRYNDMQAQTQSEISGLQSQLSALESEESALKTADANKIAELDAEIKKLQNEVKVDTKALKQEDRQLTKAHKQYQKLQQKAASEEATLNDKLKAAQAESDLAQHCASVAYSGLVRAYEDFDYETLKEVGKQLNEASDECKNVVSTYAG